jgi:hypothetical protein
MALLFTARPPCTYESMAWAACGREIGPDRVKDGLGDARATGLKGAQQRRPCPRARPRHAPRRSRVPVPEPRPRWPPIAGDHHQTRDAEPAQTLAASPGSRRAGYRAARSTRPVRAIVGDEEQDLAVACNRSMRVACAANAIPPLVGLPDNDGCRSASARRFDPRGHAVRDQIVDLAMRLTCGRSRALAAWTTALAIGWLACSSIEATSASRSDSVQPPWPRQHLDVGDHQARCG